LAGAALIMITAGINEKTGGATDRNDPAGRLKLLGENVKVYEEIVPQIVRAASNAVVPPKIISSRSMCSSCTNRTAGRRD
jgi:L-lactate dehydrogenase